MNEPGKNDQDDKEWQRLCELVAAENNPERLSRLVEQLLQELDARRKALREGGK